MILITGNIKSLQPSDAPDIQTISLVYGLSQQVLIPGGAVNSGDIAFQVNVQRTDQEIESDLRAKLAEYISTQTGLTFTEADVRGCKL